MVHIISSRKKHHMDNGYSLLAHFLFVCRIVTRLHPKNYVCQKSVRPSQELQKHVGKRKQ